MMCGPTASPTAQAATSYTAKSCSFPPPLARQKKSMTAIPRRSSPIWSNPSKPQPSTPALPGTVSSRSTAPSTFRAYTATLIWHKSKRVPTITPATSARKSSNCGKRSHVTKKQPFRLLFYGLWHQRQNIKGFPALPPQERVVAQVAAVWFRGFLMLAGRVLAANRGGCCCLLAGWRAGYLRIFSGVGGFAG